MGVAWKLPTCIMSVPPRCGEVTGVTNTTGQRPDFTTLPAAAESLGLSSSSSRIMPQLSKDEIEEVTEVFDLFDFWDGRDGAVDAAKTGDMLYCLGLNPTMTTIMKNGGVEKFGEKNYKLEEFLPIYQTVMQIKDTGTYADFMEAFKTFDREGQGFISSAELRHVLTSLGDRLTDTQMDDIIKCTDLREDLEGNVKYEDFISKVMAGPYPDK